MWLSLTKMPHVVKPYKELRSSKKEQVAGMFDGIAGRYDFLNHFLSFNIDVFWRKKAVAELINDAPKHILDIATGTGDFGFQLIKTLQPERVIGVDLSHGMLKVASDKIRRKGLERIFLLQQGDCENLSLDKGGFDAVTVAFGVRNFENLEAGLKSIYGALRPGGKTVILEFSQPSAFPIKQIYNFYSFSIVPFWGRVFSKDRKAYSYLPLSVRAFPCGESFAGIMKKIGFKEIEFKELTFGISSIYTGIK